ncbi:MAG: TonB-dependent receptor, partial [bacterium]|nr:TonB-dependent receptor [bacterium]
NSSHALVLVDGVRVNSATTGAFDFADLPADAIERIEIVRGPQSTLYGSEAVAGVVSITTRRGSPGFHVAALAEAGGDDHQRFRVALDGANGRYDYRLTVSDLRTDGISAASETAGNSEKDPYENTTVTSRLGLAFAGDGRMDLTVHHVRGAAAIDGYEYLVGPVDHLRATQEREALVASLKIKKQLGPRWAQTVTIGVNDDDLVAEDPDDFFNTYAFESRTSELSAQSDVTLSKNDVLTLGLSVEQREGGSVGSFDETVRLQSFFMQNSWSFQRRLFLTAGARHDEHSEFGGETTYRLSGAWLLPASTRLHASYGTAFKAPTLNDLFFPFFSNPELDPETSKGFDLGVEQRFLDDRLTADLTWFSSEFDDLIAYSFATFRPENIARAQSEGVELTLAYEPRPGF